ncbi:dihydrolipoyllysine-residue acetyltransferase component 2 of pyruvate dehydrogenase complex, mitochondrial-like [Salvia hispanica]|uniref:dihydrolipoyllysine-residue acetyltransferase component 2 of pyruvate dehydrogenase complex, mitochondrial-like n=1 Tax=Salvia hispanica TaxID=49212 RepID=UPI00200974ED|nr:dihydrolipoyllysine-residue acetyltransferase component 2 of pyruvate dehydrogenase complex, mitochondrial-like [Salvia hispanica]XP_047940129.1 dihydrolipoyllysine-residue acetyltransferase component 2 of pyruvate dehydrogenase complex, mitochondrial-like [Salvia hispanica]
MICASRILRHSTKLRHTHHATQKDRAFLVCWFTHHARMDANHIDDVPRSSQLDLGPGDKYGTSMFSTRGSSCQSFQSINQTPISTVRMEKGNILRTAIKGHSPATTSVYKKSQQRNFIRYYSTDSGLPPHQEIGMPSLSPTMTEGNIAKWMKKEGEKLAPGDVLCEVETDKASVEMECMEEGYLAKIVLGDGSTGIKVGEIIAVTVEEEEDLAKFKDYSPSISDAAASSKEPSPPTPTKEESPEEAATNPTERSSPGNRIFTGPLTSMLAKDDKVHISNTKGTSHDGRVAKIDIKDSPASGGKEVSPALDYTDIPQTQIGKVTASRLLQSKQTIPHYYLTVDTCVDKLMELRIHLNSLQEASGGRRISINDLVIKAAAMALREVPQCNSSWTDDYIRQYRNVNINIAVQTDNGLCVPVIKDADKKGLSRIGKEVKHLAEKARENSLKPEDYEGGTFTVSNLGGSFGVEQFRAIVNPPQAGILAVGSAERRVIPGSGPKQYEFASFMTATLSCDHRVVDGAIGAEWLKAYKGYIENPQSMLV